MNREELLNIITGFIASSEENRISRQIAISESVIGLRIFDEPIMAISDASDPYFGLLKQPTVIGGHFMAPKEWMPEAKTVISIFLPFSEEVRSGNGKAMKLPSAEWLHGRIEGQALICSLLKHLEAQIEADGNKCIVPILDARFWSRTKPSNDPSHPGMAFTSNWSERHVAFICGLGTFGLSKGLITQKGISGRFASLICDIELKPDTREYEGVYEYCTMCGKCVKNCPAGAITLEAGKDHTKCSNFINETLEIFSPRYGCGKCQVKVPCESRIPKKKV
jgi:epoxyqueuosine reductase